MNGFMSDGVYYNVDMDLLGSLITRFMPPPRYGGVTPSRVSIKERLHTEAFRRVISERWGTIPIGVLVVFLRRFSDRVLS